jgi:hypothetical protein
MIKGTLHRDHEIFNGDEGNIWKVVITTPQTRAYRHGLQAAIKYRQQRYNITLNAAKEKRHILPDGWEHNLSGLFDMCVIDEAQSIKNPTSSSHFDCKGLQPDFYALVTASPDLKYVAVVSIALNRRPSCYINCLCCCLSSDSTPLIDYMVYLRYP